MIINNDASIRKVGTTCRETPSASGMGREKNPKNPYTGDEFFDNFLGYGKKHAERVEDKPKCVFSLKCSQLSGQKKKNLHNPSYS